MIDADVVEKQLGENKRQFNDYIASKIFEAWGPITDQTGCEVEAYHL